MRWLRFRIRLVRRASFPSTPGSTGFGRVLTGAGSMLVCIFVYQLRDKFGGHADDPPCIFNQPRVGYGMPMSRE